MSKVEFVKAITYMGILFNKSFSKEIIEIWYEFFIDIHEDILKESIRELAKETKYSPSLQELLDKCRIINSNKNQDILSIMYKDGYFKKGYFCELTDEHAFRNYEKSSMWVKQNIIPKWLLEDMIKYGYKNTKMILGNNNLLIE